MAYVFRFPPSEVWDMTMDELAFWNAQAIRIGGQASGRGTEA